MKPNPFSPEFLAWLERQEDAVLLETARTDRANRRSLLFLEPVRTVLASTPEEVGPALEEIADAVAGGLHAAGWIAYEAGYALEPALRPLAHLAPAPLVRMGLYREPIVYDHREGRFERGGARFEALGERHPSIRNPQSSILTPAPTLDEPAYAAALDEVFARIADGDTYQVNFTFKLRFEHPGSAADLYVRLRRAQPVPYGAFVRAGDVTVLSFSPELFFRTDGRTIVLQPMKGTAPRGATRAEERANREWLAASAKNRAENLMIVDMLRNDVGRIARTGSVRVRRFFEIERHPTVLQATSTLEARLRPDVRIPELVRALFPSGSVTGAPKIHTMRLIRGLEPEPRGVYTGAIGFFAPSGRAVFNVAIRTLTLTGGGGEMGVGSGVVADSDAADEYRECLLKGAFLEEPPADFELFETVRWDPAKGWCALNEHLARLRGSASHFGFPYSKDAIIGVLGPSASKLQREATAHYRSRPRGAPPEAWTHLLRARIVLDRRGAVRVEAARLEPLPEPARVRIAPARTRSDDPFLRHKTTRRALYDAQLRDARRDGFFDALFLNERGELTEGARSNVFVRNGDRYRTPPLACGVLPGTTRARVLASKELQVDEEVLLVEDLLQADAVYVSNALRGLVEVVVETE